jgi:hypothetical protein
MHVEQARAITQSAIEALSEQLAQGRSEQLQTYLALMSRFHHYSFNNLILITSQRPDATHVAGYQTWQSLGRQVRKGEKAITIIAPLWSKRADAGSTNDQDPQPHRIVGFRAARVFDVTQTTGLPLPAPVLVGGDPGDYLERLRATIRNHAITLDEQPMPAGRSGFSTGGRIVLASGLSPAETFATLVHEFAHELLHQAGPKPGVTVRETEAEAIAFVVTRAIGLDTSTASSDYISLHGGDAQMLADSLETIQRTAHRIIAAIQPATATSEPLQAAA